MQMAATIELFRFGALRMLVTCIMTVIAAESYLSSCEVELCMSVTIVIMKLEQRCEERH